MCSKEIVKAELINRQLEKNDIYLNRFWSGIVKNRSPLFVPISAMGLQIIQRLDTLWDGLNTEISPAMTLVRRPGYPAFCSQAFGSSDWPLAYYSFRNLSGTVIPLVDTPTHVYQFSNSALTAVFTKSTTARTSFQKVANILYACDGTSAWKWNGSATSNIGIATPTATPGLSYSSGSLSPTVGYSYVYTYRNSSTGTTSSASPYSANTGVLTGKNITVTGSGSSDPQCDKVDIYRTADGGPVYYYLATVSNISSWSYTDSTPDADLNTFQVAPVAGVNNPIPTGASLLTWYMGRLWCAVGNMLYFSAGPDCTNGVGEEAWPAANVFPVPGNITSLLGTTQGLVVTTSDNAYVVGGTDSSTFTTPQMWQANFGVANQNCVCQDGDNLFFFTTQGQLWNFSTSLTEIGNPLEAQLGAFNPASVSITRHRNGSDEGIFISDGSANVYRYSLNFGCWSPVAQPVGGVGVIGSIETSTNNWTLMLGQTSGSSYLFGRSLTTFTDGSSPYDAYAVIGSLILAPPRQVAILNSIVVQAVDIGTYPTISVLLNNTSGTFTALPNPVPDPPQLPLNTSPWMKRHDLKAAATPLPQHVNHCQIKIDFGTDTVRNELLGLAVV